MTVYGTILPGAASIACSAALVNSLTERAKYKIKILDWHRAHGENGSLTARHFAVGRMTLYRWIRRFKYYGVVGLNEESRKPMLPGGKRFYQFTAIDVLTKRRVLRVYPSESSRNGALFLQECFLNFPFAIKAVQTDNGSTWQKEFEKLCKEKNLPHYFIYPRTPKQNTYVEISQQADKREFYQQGNVYSLYSAPRSPWPTHSFRVLLEAPNRPVANQKRHRFTNLRVYHMFLNLDMVC